MEPFFHYHSLTEAEEIRSKYSSWIGKRAHAGKGKQSVLKNIRIRQGADVYFNSRPERGYYLEFEFENGTFMNVYQFTLNNGLSLITGTISPEEMRRYTESLLSRKNFNQDSISK
jgi:hypothetical protein